MSIVAARIDNRLLHGIVANQWVPQYRPQRLMVIDDEYANDPTKKAAMRMAKPSGVALSIISEETALAELHGGQVRRPYRFRGRPRSADHPERDRDRAPGARARGGRHRCAC